jgi:acetyl-CoA carboxylase biotin carboxyl carrier protein
MSEITPKDIEALLETFESSGWSEMRLKVDGLDMFVSKTPGARPPAAVVPTAAPVVVAHPTPAATQAPTPAPGRGNRREAPNHWVAVRAPNLGTFYRSPKPGAPPYVKVGQHVEAATELCLIEVMKLFTSVIAGVSGVVREVLVEDGELVEFDQALFLVEPDA